MTRWLWRRCPTRFHSELGRETLQRRWYFVLRHGRVGRCLVFWTRFHITYQTCQFCLLVEMSFPKYWAAFLIVSLNSFDGAGWSSPVARQAHNLKVVGSNPTPATKNINKSVFYKDAILRGCVFFLCMAQCLQRLYSDLSSGYLPETN